ncbi:MBL fold metallo-hydrolase [Salisediminibacterium halotolerans]|uniref:MBL fold metallo-hydrolase n=1 Tax=Salisediminibacterium halotolerans TaxID=517425 RepID=UPI000EB54E0C|nr:MBL fold metallo-hydrolase [Salisediminibacterium halotolerans]RLJ75523.1 hydroxyacylglutathione hydrolase [Actinophytocola xinjiangensis]RPE89376.1 hydroxyacylglutathione hydrolase [Salisediminibacterium halotolerans]TWG36136.1 hydroxyacylglutathione hydrolase [Salisediminibacterium halotolerans]GEL08138.1 Zn-dependent hydrolase [Salisediminibacterium halotolerans]
MLLKYFYDKKLAQASYMVGCQAKGEAVIVDPARDIAPYLEAAEAEGLEIVGALETHIHADYVSGVREMAERLNATLYLSDEGDENWKYGYLDGLPHQLVKDGDSFTLGNLTFEVMHTPGHTPESISFLLTDGGAQADEPIGIFTGDFVFAGDIGRPDLLEKAAGIEGTSLAGAYEMFDSLERFKLLPDFLQVWPAHGAGSACGKSLGAVPSSTTGYEKRFNWALQYADKEQFARDLIDGQPEPPSYFAVMKHVNKVGPALVKELAPPEELTDAAEVKASIDKGMQVIDTRDYTQFAAGHLPGTINIPFGGSFPNWAGWLVDYDRPLVLLVGEGQSLQEIITALQSVGIDTAEAVMQAETALAQSAENESFPEIEPEQAAEEMKKDHVAVLDVRNLSEYNEANIAGAQHLMLGTLPERLNEVPTGQTILVHCGSGLRSAIACSVLQANGIKDVVNLAGGYNAWAERVRPQTAASSS